MKSVFRLFLVPLVALAFATVSFAQAKPATPATPATPASPAKKEVKTAGKPKATRITGEIVSLDVKAGTLTVKANGKEMSFAADTKGAKSALGKVKVGDRVRVSYTEKDGKLMAHSVTRAKTIAKAKAEAKATEKKAEKKEEPKTEKK